MSRKIWIDFEASSLAANSYPIEVGWVDETGQGESYLIRPEPSWTDWSSEAQGVHRISREALQDGGLPAIEVAQRLAALMAVPGISLISDAPEHDTFWGKRLLSVLDAPPELQLDDSTLVMGQACRPLSIVLPPETLMETAMRLVAEAGTDEAKIRHRALPDAMAMRNSWVRLGKLVTAEVDRLQAELDQQDIDIRNAGMPRGCA